MPEKSDNVDSPSGLRRALRWGAITLTVALLGMCSMWGVPLWIVFSLSILLAVLLSWPVRSIRRILVATSLSLAAMSAVMWGKGAWAATSWQYRFGSHYLHIEPSSAFLYISHIHLTTVSKPRRTRLFGLAGWYVSSASVRGADGKMWIVRAAALPPWLPVILFLALPSAAVMASLLASHRRRYRRRRSLCLSCGYDLTGNISGVCPECGEPRQSGSGP